MTDEHVNLMEPMMPPRGLKELEDLAVDLVQKSAHMASNIPPVIQAHIGDLVRSMNCYYSNLIEDHNTHPYDIERALAENFSEDARKRDLQLEAKAHIEVQRMIDMGNMPFPALTTEAICWVHKEFYVRLPEELRWVKMRNSEEMVEVVPGQIRETEAVVGRHLAPLGKNLSSFMRRFEEAYNFKNLSRVEQIIAIAAAHHRLLWIHPFNDGNGRVTRLISHAAFKEAEVGNGLWSISRGLARAKAEYKNTLALADENRHGDLDGRGSLTQKGLVQFCDFFLKTAVDQADYMGQLLDIRALMGRMEKHAAEQIEAKAWPAGCIPVLREILLRGEIDRGQVTHLTGYAERTARNVISDLLKLGIVGSPSIYGPLSLRFPHSVVEAYFPKLYPPALEGQI